MKGKRMLTRDKVLSASDLCVLVKIPGEKIPATVKISKKAALKMLKVCKGSDKIHCAFICETLVIGSAT